MLFFTTSAIIIAMFAYIANEETIFKIKSVTNIWHYVYLSIMYYSAGFCQARIMQARISKMSGQELQR